ncbi:hypothetical protein ACNKHL_23755 [Shigella flexneri]
MRNAGVKVKQHVTRLVHWVLTSFRQTRDVELEVEQRKLARNWIHALAVESGNVQFTAYINPYVASDELSAKRAQRLYITKIPLGGDYLVEFGEFYGGVVNLTNPEAYAWFKEVIEKNMIELGCGGLILSGRSVHRHVPA